MKMRGVSDSLLGQVASVGKSESEVYKPKKPREKDETNITFFMAKATHKALKIIAVSRGITLQGLIAEYVDRGLAEDGEAPFKRRDK